jgi:hypothetical protein
MLEVFLTVGRVIAEPDGRVEQVYFPTSGVISIVTLLKDGRKVESLMVGREGAVGLLAAFGEKIGSRSPAPRFRSTFHRGGGGPGASRSS